MRDEALKLALEALEHMLEDAKQERLTVEYWNECVDAITAIKQALAAQPAPVQSCYCPNCEAMGKELAALKAHLTEEKKVELATNWFSEDWAITKAVGMLHDYDRLLRKTTPPAAKRQWIGLTEDEFEDIELGCRSTSSGKIMAMQKVEAKLKEKNNG
jgi:hypothetical protein